jgi:hypothetical protein
MHYLDKVVPPVIDAAGFPGLPDGVAAASSAFARAPEEVAAELFCDSHAAAHLVNSWGA